jgi:hypothetical protein
LLFLPIIANIAVLTTSVGFKGTWLVTILMTTAATYLVCWEYDRLKPILFSRRKGKSGLMKYEFVWLPFLFAVGGGTVGTIWWLIRLGNFSNYFSVGVFLTVAGLLFGFAVALHHRFMPSGKLEETSPLS